MTEILATPIVDVERLRESIRAEYAAVATSVRSRSDLTRARTR